MIKCRLCGSGNLLPFLDLGFTPPADQFKRFEQLKEPEIHYPLEVCMCGKCGFAQLNHVVSKEVLYRQDYPYESSTTKTGQLHWNTFAKTVVERLGLGEKDLVVDVGSNVGVLMQSFKDQGVQIQGLDPAANIVLLAQKRGIDTICDFFNRQAVEKILKTRGHASVITATNVFAHVDDLDTFMRNAIDLLTDTGVFIFEAPYYVNLVKHLEYDTIYHEHLSYLSLKPLVPFFANYGMEVFHVEQVDIHGGSFRTYIGFKGQHAIDPVVPQLIREEDEFGLYDMNKLADFARAVAQNRMDLIRLLHKLKAEGKRIVGVSAPAKGMTLLNYCRIGPELLDVVTEKSELKIGRYTPGTHIPVVGDDYLVQEKPDYALLLAWNFAKEIMNNLSEYRANGGKFIIPIPTPRIID